MPRLCMVRVIVWVIFGYYMDKYSDGICIKNEKKTKTDNTTNLDLHIDCTHYPHSYFCVFFLFFLNSNNCVAVVVEGIKTQHV